MKRSVNLSYTRKHRNTTDDIAAFLQDIGITSADIKRPCSVCGESQYRKKVWESYKSKVICMTCGQNWTFDINGNPVQCQRWPVSS